MLAYRKERIDNTIHFFAKEHYKKTHQYPSQTAIYKYLAFFEFRLLKSRGEMPLELKYRAMDHGPVPVEIYDKRDKSPVSEGYEFVNNGANKYIIKARGHFDPDYFSETELEEMNNLILFFAQNWVDAKIMSDASHQDIKAWRKTYKESPNAFINITDEFIHDVMREAIENLTDPEIRFLTIQNIKQLSECHGS